MAMDAAERPAAPQDPPPAAAPRLPVTPGLPGFAGFASRLAGLGFRHVVEPLLQAPPDTVLTTARQPLSFRALDGLWISGRGGNWLHVDSAYLNDCRRRWEGSGDPRADAIRALLNRLRRRMRGDTMLLRQIVLYQLGCLLTDGPGGPTPEAAAALGVHSSEAASLAASAAAGFPAPGPPREAGEQLPDALGAGLLRRAAALAALLPDQPPDRVLAATLADLEERTTAAETLMATGLRRQAGGRLRPAAEAWLGAARIALDDPRVTAGLLNVAALSADADAGTVQVADRATDRDTDRDTDRGPDADADRGTDRATNGDTDRNPERDTDTDAGTDRDTDRDTDRGPDADADRGTDRATNGDTDRNPERDTDTDAGTDRDTDRGPDADADRGTDRATNGDRDRDGDANGAEEGDTQAGEELGRGLRPDVRIDNGDVTVRWSPAALPGRRRSPVRYHVMRFPDGAPELAVEVGVADAAGEVRDPDVPTGVPLRYAVVPRHGERTAGVPGASRALVSTPEVRGLRWKSVPDGVALSWRDHPRAVGTRVMRDAEPPEPGGAGGWLDRPLPAGGHWYRVSAGYLAADGDVVWSPGRTVQARAETWPSPVPAVSVVGVHADGRVDLTWTAPARGAERLVPWQSWPAASGEDVTALLAGMPVLTDEEAPAAPAAPAASGGAPAESYDLGRRLTVRPDRGAATRITAVSVLDGRAVAGPTVIIEAPEAVAGLRVEREGDAAARVRFRWPEPAVLVLVRWEQGRRSGELRAARSRMGPDGVLLPLSRQAATVTVVAVPRPDVTVLTVEAARFDLPAVPPPPPAPPPPGTAGTDRGTDPADTRPAWPVRWWRRLRLRLGYRRP